MKVFCGWYHEVISKSLCYDILFNIMQLNISKIYQAKCVLDIEITKERTPLRGHHSWLTNHYFAVFLSVRHIRYLKEKRLSCNKFFGDALLFILSTFWWKIYTIP